MHSLLRIAGQTVIAALCAAGALLCAAMAADDPEAPVSRIVPVPAETVPPVRETVSASAKIVPDSGLLTLDGPALARVALTDEGASRRERAAAELEVFGLTRPDDFLRAITAVDRQLIELYLNAGANLNAVGEQGRTPLLNAALARAWSLVPRFLEAGANPRVADTKGLTPLMAASLAGHVPTITRLLDAGAPIDAMDSKGRLALGYAVALRQMAAVSTLLARQPTLPDAAHGGNDLAAAALETGDLDVMEDTLRRLPGGLAWTTAARTAFEKAVAAHDTLMAPLLMEKFAGPPSSGDHLEPLLAYAVARRESDNVRTLLDLGADPNTVLDEPGDKDFKNLVGQSFMHYYIDQPGMNVLMVAAGLKQVEMVKMLLDHGANRNACTKGKSDLIALYFAAWADSPDTIQVLLGDAPSKDDVRIEVSLDQQRARYYRSGQLILSTEISTGRDGFATKPGEYVITDKHLEHHSTLYHNASMPYFMRLSCQAFGLHEGVVTGRPASHGCIRLPGDVARRLFKEAPIGTWVSIR